MNSEGGNRVASLTRRGTKSSFGVQWTCCSRFTEVCNKLLRVHTKWSAILCV